MITENDKFEILDKYKKMTLKEIRKEKDILFHKLKEDQLIDMENNYTEPSVKPPASDGDRICDTCNKEDVCMYKGELAQAVKEITQISERVNVFIDTDIRCKKWSGKVPSYRVLETI